MPKMFRLFSTPPPTNQPLRLNESLDARRGSSEVGQASAGPLRPGVTAIDVRKDVRSNQIAEANAAGPGVFHLDAAGQAEKLIVDSALQAAELAVAKYAGHPATAELPVIADTDRTEPTVATDALIDRGRNAQKIGVRVSIPDATAGATKDVKASPVRGRSNHRSFRVRTCPEISRRGRSRESRQRGQSDH